MEGGPFRAASSVLRGRPLLLRNGRCAAPTSGKRFLIQLAGRCRSESASSSRTSVNGSHFFKISAQPFRPRDGDLSPALSLPAVFLADAPRRRVGRAPLQPAAAITHRQHHNYGNCSH